MAPWRRRDEETLIAELHARVHPPALACAVCGARTDAEPDTVITMALDAVELHWPTCADCAFLGVKLDRTIAANVLEIDISAVPRGYRVERYSDVPGARPSWPQEPWAHLSRRELAVGVRQAQEHVVTTQAEQHDQLDPGGPCRVCGATERDEAMGRTNGRCWSCESRLFGGIDGYGVARLGAHRDWRRDLVANVLVGVPERERLGSELGVRFFDELSLEERDGLPARRGPFHWHARDIPRWRREHGQPIERPTW